MLAWRRVSASAAVKLDDAVGGAGAGGCFMLKRTLPTPPPPPLAAILSPLPLSVRCEHFSLTCAAHRPVPARGGQCCA